MKCVACGCEELVEGFLVDKWNPGEIGFKTSDSSTLSRMIGTGVMSVKAFGCAQCGHLQLGVELSETLLKEHQHVDETLSTNTE